MSSPRQPETCIFNETRQKPCLPAVASREGWSKHILHLSGIRAEAHTPRIASDNKVRLNVATAFPDQKTAASVVHLSTRYKYLQILIAAYDTEISIPFCFDTRAISPTTESRHFTHLRRARCASKPPPGATNDRRHAVVTLVDGCNVISAPSKWKSLIKPVMPLITAGVGDALMLFASYRNMRHLRAPRACRTMSRDVEIGASRRKEAQLLTATVTLSITEFEHRSHCLQRASQRGDLCSVSDTCIEAGVRAIAVSVSC